MSELQKSFAKAQLAKLPPDISMFDTIDETGSREDESSSASSASSTGTLVPSPTRHLFARRSQGLVSSFHPILLISILCCIQHAPGSLKLMISQILAITDMDGFLCARIIPV